MLFRAQGSRAQRSALVPSALRSKAASKSHAMACDNMTRRRAERSQADLC